MATVWKDPLASVLLRRQGSCSAGCLGNLARGCKLGWESNGIKSDLRMYKLIVTTVWI